MCILPRQRGISLIELIMFIMIIGVALAGILLVMNTTTMGSANPMIRKQSLAIAESLLEEVELMPFTYCDPDDANAATAQVAAVAVNGCTALVEGLGAENDVSRYDAALPFDNVSDYSGFSMAAGGILDITGTAIGPAAGYSATIAVAQAAIGAVPANDSLLITVTVTGPDGVGVVIQGYRTRYSPRI
jgi:MSHA pilin protein MshD